ncbi:lipopolysaccharide biosynthesis protein [Niabella drilacis]|uniref:Membrane protein involved in the export of O-antigen and teichoic acid n=1 Tax=Niabella drilacis (strain DSM 25811 / CCM 8410 / CCUG 62505 / LMG 26954 / E90) TaxID=1285928 RepID=A0A1G6VNY0_NIADE|nr:oligosaccharide flippase family protein [Niabella drilacis]SDD55241.1 Membrane protein involved in the export of O-antigen and teichoic acid [Niabella drilacis]
MSGIKQLAGQTLWYGGSSIVAKLINYLLTPLLTGLLTIADYGEMSMVYSFIPFMNIIFTYGMETAFFRFAQQDNRNDVYNTSSLSLIFTSVFFSVALILFRHPIASLLKVAQHPEYITISALIIGFDALSTIPFSKLRLDGRPKKFAAIKVLGILVNFISVYVLLGVVPGILEKDPHHWLRTFYNKDWAVGYVFVANLLQSMITLLLLSKEFLGFKLHINKELWRKMLLYGMPLILAGFAGMVNETFDRIMLGWWAPAATEQAAKAQVGIYSACYKLSILITLAVQGFRMGAEPFFFKQSSSENATRIYARVMKFFVITLCLMFLAVMLYLDIWKHFIRNPKMWVGLKVVPILLLANMFVGIYYNLSIWYKLGNKTIAGAYITLIGALVTLLINYIFIPRYSYMACAWATFLAYGAMMVVSYIWGQKEYRVPYAWKKLCAYIIIAVVLSFIHRGIVGKISGSWFNYGSATVLLLLYTLFILRVERKEFQRLPLIGKFLR